MKITMLGCGSSAGVPFIACNCGVCTSKNPKNTRTRVSVFVESEGGNILIDTSPDLRQQALREGITRIDAVLYTHEHADHVMGIDELRSFNHLSGKAIPVYAEKSTMEALKTRFAYAFMEKPENLWYRPCLTPHPFGEKAVGNISVLGQEITTITLGHGKVKTIGYRIGNFAYCTDCDVISDEAFAALEGIDTWIVDCLRYTPSYSHAHLDLTLSWIERLKPRRTILTHMNHEFDYDTLNAELPNGVEAGYDGLTFEL